MFQGMLEKVFSLQLIKIEHRMGCCRMMYQESVANKVMHTNRKKVRGNDHKEFQQKVVGLANLSCSR